LLLLGLFVVSLQNYLLFHSLAEIFSIVIAFCIFVLAWNSRDLARNSYLLFIGIAYLFVGSLDLIHTLAYKGIGVFHGYSANLSTQLWIAARYLESISLLIGPFLIVRKLKTNFVFIGYTLTITVLLGSIFYWNIFPICYIEGEGLTTFKVTSEYIISFILVASIIALLQKRHKFEKSVLQLLFASIVVTIASELTFTLYTDVYGLWNLIGHYLKIVSFYLIYKAIVETSLKKPYALLFRDLKQSEDILRTAKDRLEHEVSESTAKLQKAKLNYKTVADFTHDWEYWESPEGTYRYVSPSCERITGHKPEEFLENPHVLQKLILPEDKALWDKHRQEALNSKGLHEVQFRICKRDGEIRWIEHACQPVTDEKGKFLGFRASNRDISERKHAEENLHESEARFRMMYENAPVMIDAFDGNGRCVMWNKECEKVFGWTAEEIFSHENPLILFYPDPEMQRQVMETVTSKPEKVFREWKPKRKDGSETTCLWANFKLPDGLVINLGYDITERKQSEEEIQLLREEYTHIARVSAMGELVASLAHELKQPLAAIRSNAQAAQRFLTGEKPDLDEFHEILADIIKDNRRADEVIGRLRTLMRKGNLQIAELNINELVQEIFPLIHSYEIMRNISLEFELDERIPLVAADRVQIQQVILNLLLNSSEALANMSGNLRKIVVQTSQKDQQNVTVAIKDNGPGIDEQIMDRLFEPFYTTKKEGMGMGLSISRSIIEAHRGSLWHENNPDRGVTFYFTIPVFKESLA
jgi:PAS domain S-box-containing protein